MFDPRGCVECESDYGHCSIHGKVELAVVSEIMLLIASGGSSNFQNRVSHSLAVGHRMRELSEYAGPVSPAAVDVAHALGNLHDIGYFNPITGMHAYDGALMVSGSGWGFLANGIAWHSTAEWEYAERGIASIDFNKPHSRSMLWVADFTTSSTGNRCTATKRVSGILDRYPFQSPVVTALMKSMPELNESLTLFGEQEVSLEVFRSIA